MHAGLAQQLQRTGWGSARIIAGEMVPSREMKKKLLR